MYLSPRVLPMWVQVMISMKLRFEEMRLVYFFKLHPAQIVHVLVNLVEALHVGVAIDTLRRVYVQLYGGDI